MEYKLLNNGIKMPMEGIGTFMMSPDEAEEAVVNALDYGYRLVDTANAYVNEKAVGRAIKRSGLKREIYFLKLNCGRAFMKMKTLWKKLLSVLIQII